MSTAPLIVHTARISTRDPDRFDITRKGAWLLQRAGKEAPGDPFAPSWPLLRAAKAGELTTRAYEVEYLIEMRVSYRDRRPEWEAFLARRRVVVFCYEVDPLECHRSLFAEICRKLGADVRGELPA